MLRNERCCKGYEDAESCYECIMCVDGKYGESCLLTNQYIESIVENCPLVAIPKKHGRLIDADAFIEHLEKEFADGYEKNQSSDADIKMLITKMYELLIDKIKQRPTVVESEE